MIDFHCHLDLYPDPHAIRDECARRRIYVLSVTTTPSAWRGTSSLAGGAQRIHTALGLHPQLAHERKGELRLFDALLPETRYIGEIGLDGAPDFREHWNDQLAVFEHILVKCAEAGGRIMSIHSRRASGPVLDCLDKHPNAGTPVLHWFTGTARELDRAVEMECWFSIGPAMLISNKGKALAARIPRDRILTESDGPFAQVGGVSIKPWEVDRALTRLAEIWSGSREEAEVIVRTNLLRLLSAQEAPTG